ncbi:MAG TPA: hypothetical protein VNA89_03890 [Gemmatimonadaceae bacterium]|nr:hypothetical protein [Gemmatimonadaceae bacterium]
MQSSTSSPTALRRALLLDAAASGTMGLVLAVTAGALEPTLGLPVALLRWVGIFLLPFAGFLVAVARRPRPPRGAVLTIVVGNALWVVASGLLLLGGRVAPTPLGEAFVLAQAAAVAVFAWLEYRGLRRAGVSLAAERAA